MKIFSSTQVRKWDEYTIVNEPINSIDLMERAAKACFNWLSENLLVNNPHFVIFCGNGNNGGDGLAIARMLVQNKLPVDVYILELAQLASANFKANLEKLHYVTPNIHFIKSVDSFPVMNDGDIVIDALVGSGLNKPLNGDASDLINHLNFSAAKKISIDMPSGLFADNCSIGNTILKSSHTLCIQNYKLGLLLAENEPYCGQVHILPIGLHKNFERAEKADELTDFDIIKSIYKPRNAFAHKGTFGHATLLCGSMGMMGAAVLSSSACLRSGVGKLTVQIPKCGLQMMQSSLPEAICKIAGDEFIEYISDIENFSAVGIGPGIGLQPSHKKMLIEIFEKANKPIVIDADALNCIAQNKELLKLIPQKSILTPHPLEFERLFGKRNNDFETITLVKEKSKEFNVNIILKGHFSFISDPEGKSYFNSTGNAGMATAGSGDVLTGILTGLLAQGYSPLQASVLGTYLHGSAGDIAADKYSQEALLASDIINNIGEAFKQIISG